MTANEARKRWRERMKREHRCNNCGGQDERTLEGRVKCAACAQRDNQREKARLDANPERREAKNANLHDWRRQLKAHNMCIDCKKVDAYTLNGRARCFDCAEKYARKCRERRSEDRDAANQAHRALRDRWRETGRCVNCGHEKPSYDHHMVCMPCRVKMYNLKKRQREARDDWFPRGTPGRCWFCLQPVMEGKKVCKKCYDARMPSLEKAREAARANNAKHIWRAYDREAFKRKRVE